MKQQGSPNALVSVSGSASTKPAEASRCLIFPALGLRESREGPSLLCFGGTDIYGHYLFLDILVKKNLPSDHLGLVTSIWIDS